jgi:hypothetical protein
LPTIFGDPMPKFKILVAPVRLQEGCKIWQIEILAEAMQERWSGDESYPIPRKVFLLKGDKLKETQEREGPM